MGPSGSGKSTLMHCCAGAGQRHQRVGVRRRHRAQPARGQGADPAAARRDRLRVPVVQPGAHADRRGEHPAAAVDRRPQAGPGVVRPGDRHRRPPGPARPPSERAAPAASSSGWRWPGRWPAGPRSCSPTSPPATSTRAPARRCSRCCGARVDEFGQTVVMVTHDPVAAAFTDRVLFLADGRVVDEVRQPDREIGPGPDDPDGRPPAGRGLRGRPVGVTPPGRSHGSGAGFVWSMPQGPARTLWWAWRGPREVSWVT